jgi:catechol 2,3-dioxygenase-like lactoylglutathione lyase family enzyme
MTSRLHELCFDAQDPPALARFWAGLLDLETADDGVTVLPRLQAEFPIRFLPTREKKDGPNQIHLHLTSTSEQDQRSVVARALDLGGRHLDVGQTPEEGHVVLADPEGNELCVIEPGNSFLAGCGFLGELACDGTREVGHFWSEALGWPLVWDQDEETAIQSPAGGAKIAWGGPPVRPRTGRNRMHFHLAAPEPHVLEAEVDRLVTLGGARLAAGSGTGCEARGRVLMADPDGNEFCLLPAAAPPEDQQD